MKLGRAETKSALPAPSWRQEKSRRSAAHDQMSWNFLAKRALTQREKWILPHLLTRRENAGFDSASTERKTAAKMGKSGLTNAP
jgi:hypothetical protein